MSSSSTSSAAVYVGLPLPPGTSLSWMPPSSLFFWQQYNELGGIQDSEVPGGSGSPTYTAALEVLDEDMPQYIHDNTEDEFTHFTFLNAYLESRGADAVDLSGFANLPSSKAEGAQEIGRLT